MAPAFAHFMHLPAETPAYYVLFREILRQGKSAGMSDDNYPLSNCPLRAGDSWPPLVLHCSDTGNCYITDFPVIREISARIMAMIIIHFPIVHAIRPINPRIINIIAITMKNIPSAKSQSIFSSFTVSVNSHRLI
jgi:hypothetical protein